MRTSSFTPSKTSRKGEKNPRLLTAGIVWRGGANEFPPQQSLGSTSKSLFDIWCLYSFRARQSEDRDTSGATDDCFL